jgi:hypothetical protein
VGAGIPGIPAQITLGGAEALGQATIATPYFGIHKDIPFFGTSFWRISLFPVFGAIFVPHFRIISRFG